MSSARKLQSSDYWLVKAEFTKYLTRRLKLADRKSWFRLIDIDTVMSGIFEAEHAYIVDDGYLVVYELGEPWYSTETILSEKIVLRLVKHKRDFSVVPAFLERKAQEAGVKLVAVGTALAATDAALASLYSSSGYRTETHILTKEI